MNLQTGLSILTVLVAALALWRAHFGGATADAKELATALAGLKGRVDAHDTQIAAMNTDLIQVKADVARLPVIDAKIDGLDRLVNTRLDTMDRTLQRIEDRLEGAAFAPRQPSRPRSVSAK